MKSAIAIVFLLHAAGRRSHGMPPGVESPDYDEINHNTLSQAAQGWKRALYFGRPTWRVKSANRASVRRLSKIGSTLR
jgi:hypothetical protein